MTMPSLRRQVVTPGVRDSRKVHAHMLGRLKSRLANYQAMPKIPLP